MSIVYNRKTRRQFLVGSGQALLALPLLPSLLPNYAHAQAAVVPRRMMNFLFQHHWRPSSWISRSAATDSVGSMGIREKLMSSMGGNASSVISPILSNSIYSSLLQRNQITIVRGMNVQLSAGSNGHVTRGLGGHVVEEFGSSSTSTLNRSTFDHVIEQSSSISGGVNKVVRIDLGGGWAYVKRTGNQTINPNPYGYDRLGEMYNSVFSSLTSGGTTPAPAPSPTDPTNQRKTNILNRVFPAFQSFKNNRKISSEDKARLDQHLGFISDLQKAVAPVIQQPQPTPTPTISCQKPAAQNWSGLSQQKITETYVDLLALAFKCGLTQFAGMIFEYHGANWIPGLNNSELHGLMHGDSGATLQTNAYRSFQGFGYETVANRLLSALDQQEGSSGRTYLDNMIVNMLGHCGASEQTGDGGPHPDDDIQHVMFGSMGGRLRAGRYYLTPGTPAGYGVGSTLPQNTFFMSLLELMGIPSSEYSPYSTNGRGFGYYSDSAAANFGNRVYSPLTEIMS